MAGKNNVLSVRGYIRILGQEWLDSCPSILPTPFPLRKQGKGEVCLMNIQEKSDF